MVLQAEGLAGSGHREQGKCVENTKQFGVREGPLEDREPPGQHGPPLQGYNQGGAGARSVFEDGLSWGEQWGMQLWGRT